MDEAGPSCPSMTLRLRPEKSLLKETVSNIGKQEKELQSKWSQEEMLVVMKGLDTHGLTRLQAISNNLPHKTPEQVKGWLWKMSKDAYKLKRQNHEVDGILHNDECALGIAIANRDRCKMKTKSLPIRQLSAISKSLLLIENLEQHPIQSGENDIDFKQLYNALYMSMKGYPFPKMNAATLKFFTESMHYLLKAAASYPIESFPLEESEELTRIAESEGINPQSLDIDLLKARIDETVLTSAYDVATEELKNWLTTQDWSLI